MYGTIARLRVKPGMLDAFRETNTRLAAELNPAGIVFEYTCQAGGDENELWIVVAFENREAYEKNAADPAQFQRYLELRALLDEDPEWHAGQIIAEHHR